MPHESVRAIVIQQTAEREQAIKRLARAPYTLGVADLDREMALRGRLAKTWRLSVPESDT